MIYTHTARARAHTQRIYLYLSIGKIFSYCISFELYIMNGKKANLISLFNSFPLSHTFAFRHDR